MFRYTILGSGSCGNSYYFENENQAFLLDAGYSCREILQRMNTCGLDPQKLQALVITHLHQDHFRGAEVLARQLDIPVFMHHKHDPQKIFRQTPRRLNPINSHDSFELPGFILSPLKTAHDSPHSLSFSIQTAETLVTVITDTGKTDPAMLRAASDSEILFLEANYDLTMLMEGPYHFWLKKRIASAEGHLSNEDAVRFVNEIQESGKSSLKKIYFCHLSGTNNHPDLLRRYLEQYLQWPGEWEICRKGAIFHPGP
ncbi:MAG: MBL fold metallo-hydrolase [Spirochaetales bacterium]|nr:MBL fold metallo-hydrolase [Spirochaetales bacterium]